MNIADFNHNPIIDEVVDILCKKTNIDNRDFFRVQTIYKMAQLATSMRCTVDGCGFKKIPTNVFALNLADSGFSKGRSSNILDDEIFKDFKINYIDSVFDKIKDASLEKIKADKVISGMDIDEADRAVEKEYSATGSYLHEFDEATKPALKQLKHKLAMAKTGALNQVIDEIGNNFSANAEIMDILLELYDKGKSKTKLIKNTAESSRVSDIQDEVPVNALWFGTPSRLLDGGKIEQELFDRLEEGYARRLLFGYVSNYKTKKLTAKEKLDGATDIITEVAIKELSDFFGKLANVTNHNKTIEIPDEVGLLLFEYQNYCEDLVDKMKNHQILEKVETQHRYWKVLKIAGVFAFIESKDSIEISHLESAIKLVEDSGISFKKLLAREKPYERLANYLADLDEPVTQVDLVEELPFYRGSEQLKRELLNLAIAWGYKQNISITREVIDSIEFIHGNKLSNTDLDNVILSISKDVVENYIPKNVPFDSLDKLLAKGEGWNWCTHHFKDKYRKGENALDEFNLIALDIDDGLRIEEFEGLMRDFTYILATTKRHTKEKHRFRVVLPMETHLKLNEKDYSSFMINLFEWLPFDVDTATKDIARKWSTCSTAIIRKNKGKMLDVKHLLPKTKQNETYKTEIKFLNGLSAVERWFIKSSNEGNRNNNLIRYAFMLLDSGKDVEDIDLRIRDLNSRLSEPLKDSEITSTIMKTIIREDIKRNG